MAEARYRPVPLGELTPLVERRRDGSLVVRARQPLGAYPIRFTERLIHWARLVPDRTLLAWRANGSFACITYGETLAAIRSLGQALIDRGLSADRPLAILSGNDRDHLLLALAAQHVGVPYVPISPAYSLVSADFSTLKYALSLLTPGMVFASDGQAFERALNAAVGPTVKDVEIVTRVRAPAGRQATALDTMLATRPTAEVDRAHAAIGPDTMAKILLTSGSTGTPKAVANTHRMLCSNQQMIAQVLPFLRDDPPVLVDWLPWHHTFGGNHNIGIVLFNGGSLYLDEGRPMPGAFDESVRNLREIAPTVYLNVPKGYEELVRALRRDRGLAEKFFSRLRLLFYAAAALPQHVADELQAIAVDTCGERLLLVTGLGATETAPMAICRPWQDDLSSAIGLPVPGLEAKLVPSAEKLEVRVRGPNVAPGYWRQEALTRAAFDEEGFYCMGDAVCLADPGDVTKGFVFDGRIAEDFKLATGSWVNVGPLRATIIAQFAPYVRARIHELLCEHAAKATGGTTRVARAMLLEEPPLLDANEVTDKGSLNQRAILQRRATLVDELYSEAPSPRVIVGC